MQMEFPSPSHQLIHLHPSYNVAAVAIISDKSLNCATRDPTQLFCQGNSTRRADLSWVIKCILSLQNLSSSFSALAFSGQCRLASEREPTFLISKAESTLTSHFGQLEPVPQFIYM